MKKKIAIIGANASICKLIRKAKDMGYETHVFAWKANAPGETEADFFYPISISDKQLILEKCRHIGPNGVTSVTSDFAYETVNYVASNLGLACNEEKSETLARDKFEMRKAFRECGLSVPEFAISVSSEDLPDLASLSYPLITKPSNGWSSKGVRRVDDEGGLASSIEYSRSQSMSGKVVIEEFIEGPEYSCECISYQGEHAVLAFTEKHTSGYPYYVEVGHSQPARLSVREKEKAVHAVLSGLKALGIKNGASHSEFKIAESGEVYLIEVGARMGGDCIGTDLVPMSTGVDYLADVIRVACGERPQLQFGNERNAEVRFFFTPEEQSGFIDHAQDRQLEIVEVAYEDGWSRTEVRNSSERYGHCLYFVGDKGEK